MGFFDFFKNLFGGQKSKFAPDELDINITDNAININGNIIDVPCHLDSLKKFFGKPRKFVGKSGNINFTWDGLGVYCYTQGNNVVYCFAIKVNPSEIATDFDPKNMFRGKLNISGAPWEEVMYGGDDMEVARQRDIDGLSLFAEYTDFDNGDKNGCHGAYSGVEIQLG